MADINLIINSLHTIATAAYQKVHEGPPSSRKTGHEVAFDQLKGAAEQLEAIFRANAAPSRDSQENIAAQFVSMKKNVDVYCAKTGATDAVLRAFNKASTEWEALRNELRG